MMKITGTWHALLLCSLLAVGGCGAFEDLDEIVVDAAKMAAAEAVKDIVQRAIEKTSEELLDVEELPFPDGE
jgi:hypothetical protein